MSSVDNFKLGWADSRKTAYAVFAKTGFPKEITLAGLGQTCQNNLTDVFVRLMFPSVIIRDVLSVWWQGIGTGKQSI